MRTGNIGGIQGGRRPEQEECHKPTVIAVVEVIRDILHKLIYADNLTVVAGSGADLQERLVERKEIFGRHGLKVQRRRKCFGSGSRKKIRYTTGWEEI